MFDSTKIHLKIQHIVIGYWNAHIHKSGLVFDIQDSRLFLETKKNHEHIIK